MSSTDNRQYFNFLFFLFITTTLIFFSYFSRIINYGICTDIQEHISIFIKNPVFNNITPGYMFLLGILSGFSKSTEPLLYSAIFTLSMCMGLKLFFSVKIFENIENHNLKKNILISSLCLFLAPIPINDSLYFNTLPITVIHNSTSIVAMVFVLLIFHQTIYFIREYSHYRFFNITLLSLIMCTVKPSFLFAYIPALPILHLTNKNLRPNIRKSIFLSLTLLIIIFLQSLLHQASGRGIGVDFLFIHKIYSVNFFVDSAKYILSILFPICVIIFSDINKIKKDYILHFSWILLIFSVLIAFFIVESKVGKLSGNFYWQIHMSNFILFLISTKYLNLSIKKSSSKFRDLFIIFVFLAHFFSGFNYLVKIITRGHYG